MAVVLLHIQLGPASYYSNAEAIIDICMDLVPYRQAEIFVFTLKLPNLYLVGL
jgi:hypothetical protein